MRYLSRTFLVTALLAGCAAAPPPPPAPLVAVAFLPVWDPPGRSAVTGVFTFDSWVRPGRDAVGETLATALRTRLTAQGIRVAIVATPGGYAPVTLRDAVAAAATARGQDPLLYVRVLKWEANDVTRPERVDALIEAALLQAGSGKLLWSAKGPDGPVTTRGATSLAAGYQRAADAVAAWLVARWRAGP